MPSSSPLPHNSPLTKFVWLGVAFGRHSVHSDSESETKSKPSMQLCLATQHIAPDIFSDPPVFQNKSGTVPAIDGSHTHSSPADFLKEEQADLNTSRLRSRLTHNLALKHLASRALAEAKAAATCGSGSKFITDEALS